MAQTITVEITLSGRAAKFYADGENLDTEKIKDTVFYGFANELNKNGVTDLDGAFETVEVSEVKTKSWD